MTALSRPVLSASFHFGSVSGNKRADIPFARGAEQGVDERMNEGVGVGMAGEPDRRGDENAAEDELPAGGQPVNVVADPGPKLQGRPPRSSNRGESLS